MFQVISSESWDHRLAMFFYRGAQIRWANNQDVFPVHAGLHRLGVSSYDVFEYAGVAIVLLYELPTDSSIQWIQCRHVCQQLSGEALKQYLTVLQWVTWREKTRYCAQCGASLLLAPPEGYQVCSACDQMVYPSIAPAVLVLVRYQDQLLLAHAPHFKNDMYGVISGFVDPGETAEEAAMREVKEEVGLTIQDLRYVMSQSWPFSSSFLMAFEATVHTDKLCVNTQELSDAQWFHWQHLPNLPHKMSVSRQLIDHVVLSFS